MPSPFPGMDPFIEKPGRWPGFHLRMIAVIGDILVERLPPQFIVSVEERVYVSDESDLGRHALIPDISIIELPERVTKFVAAEDGGGVEVAEPIVMQTILDEEIREARIEILDAESREIVTVIEVLSPSNKIDGAYGRKSYHNQRLEIMNSPAHFVEIDLLRGGRPFIPSTVWDKGDYFVHVARAGKRRKSGQLWPFRLDERLPKFWVPLQPDGNRLALDLQEVMNTVYDRGGFKRLLDYRSDPEPPLTPAQREWADQLLKRQGLR